MKRSTPIAKQLQPRFSLVDLGARVAHFYRYSQGPTLSHRFVLPSSRSEKTSNGQLILTRSC